jgi:hypothetical protein
MAVLCRGCGPGAAVWSRSHQVQARTKQTRRYNGRSYRQTGFHQPWPHQVEGRELGDVEYALGKDEWEQQNGIAAG